MSNIHSSYLGRFLTAVVANILIHVWLSFGHEMRANIANLLVLMPTGATQGIHILEGVRWVMIERLIHRLLHLMIQVRLELYLSQGSLDSCLSTLSQT